MTKFFEMMESIPLVQSLQALAGLQIVLGVLNIAFNLIPQITINQFGFKALLAITQLILGNLAQVLFSPFILLGLAAVIQLMSARNKAMGASKAASSKSTKKKG